MSDRLLTVNELTLGFANHHPIEPVVSEVSFHIDRNETFALVGESGSGKTLTALSLIQLLPLDIHIQEGSQIFLEKHSLLELSEVEMRKIRGKKIGIIFQEP